MSVLIMPVAAVSGTLSERFGHRLVGGAGLAVSAIGFGAFATLGASSNFWHFLGATVIIGAGAALAMTPATNAIISSLPRAKQGVASAVNDTARELGAAFGVAVLGSVFNIGYRHDDRRSSRRRLDLGRQPGPRGARHRDQGGRRLAATARPLASAARDAFAAGMRDAVLFGMGLLLVGALFVWFRGASAAEAVVEDELDDDDEFAPELVA